MSDRLVELAKRRGFFFPASGAYGGTAGFYAYGPQGAALKRNLIESWREQFLTREGHMEIDAPTVMPESVFEASGHLDTFDDMIIECPSCGESHRADHLVEDETDIDDAEGMSLSAVEEIIAEQDLHCPDCGASLAGIEVSAFNLMFGTNIGPGSSSPGYLRPETAQGIFVEFPQLKEYARNQLPFGVGQIGRAYRNEISPRRSIVRVRELTQAELEHFIDPETDKPPLSRVAGVDVPLYSAAAQADDGEIETMTVNDAVEAGVVNDWIAYYLGVAAEWYERVGVDMDRFRYRQHQPEELSHYSSDCWDAEVEVDGNWIELTGFAYRGSYDLSKHDEYSDEEFTLFKQYDEPITVERPTVDPDMSVLGPEFGSEASDIAEELQRLAETDPDAFEGETVTVTINDEDRTVPVDVTGFAVEEVTESGEHITPHVIEPSFGIDRLIYTVLAHGYREDEVDGEPRTSLALQPDIAPTTVGVFPLMAKDGMAERAQEIVRRLRSEGFTVNYDDSGAIGRRYRRQDEIGTPYCVTVDYESLEDDTVTVRERDSTEQDRVAVDDLCSHLRSRSATQ
ncbi:glycine--tRNA ligase [Halocatena pleomorpha]|uniref:glycine--tRNA ligase n=1 Tax=Halocatena pleomorpha TaxID=1785090 RepID=A0A3P3R917_9EURY|nr:glycine--tRNA ligase [Halocatena pleomorpha]RRJ29150.1 glycine--tRNA ligase [Halocatena pleomorpha]